MTRTSDVVPDPLYSQVQGCVRLYDCPDIASVDGYLAELARSAGRTTFPKLLAQYKIDQDLLLDRRLWLELTSPPIWRFV